MVSNTITYARPITYRWDLRWGRHPCGILSYLYQKVGPYWEVRLTGLGLSRVVCVEAGCVKFRPQTSTSVSIGDSWWEERFLMALFLKLICSSWRIQRLVLLKFFMVHVSEKSFLNEILVYGYLITWFVWSLLCSWSYLYELHWCMPRKEGRIDSGVK